MPSLNFYRIKWNLYAFMFYLYTVFSAISISGMTIILSLFLLIYAFNIKNKLDKTPKDFSVILVFYLWRAITLAFNNIYSKIIPKFFGGIWEFICYPVVSSFSVSRTIVKNVLLITIWINILVLIYGVFQEAFHFTIAYKTLFNGGRFTGFHSNPLRFAGYYSSVLIISLVFGLFVNRFYLLTSAILAFGLFLNGSRTYWISVFIVVIILYFIKSRKTTLYILFFTIFITSTTFILFKGSLIPRSTSIGKDLELRMNFWKAGIEIFLSNPIVGVGYGEVGKYLQPYFEKGLIDNTSHCHNTYITVLAENGLLGLTFLLAFFTYFTWKYWQYYKTYNDIILKVLSISLYGVFINLMIASLTEHIIKNFVLWRFVSFLMGITEAYRRSITLPQADGPFPQGR